MKNYELIPVNLIVPNPKNFYSQQDFSSLRESIEKLTLLEPILVKPVGDKFMILSGQRRFEAVTSLKHDKIPCLIVDSINSEEEEMFIIISSNNQREKTWTDKALEAIELKKIFSVGQGKRNDLVKNGNNDKIPTRDKIGQIIGISGIYVDRLIEMYTNHPTYVNSIYSSQISFNQAYEIYRKEQNSKQRQIEKANNVWYKSLYGENMELENYPNAPETVKPDEYIFIKKINEHFLNSVNLKMEKNENVNLFSLLRKSYDTIRKDLFFTLYHIRSQVNHDYSESLRFLIKAIENDTIKYGLFKKIETSYVLTEIETTEKLSLEKLNLLEAKRIVRDILKCQIVLQFGDIASQYFDVETLLGNHFVYSDMIDSKNNHYFDNLDTHWLHVRLLSIDEISINEIVYKKICEEHIAHL